MGAGVTNLGYNQGDGMHVLNGTTTLLKKGELVLWDNTTPSSTDKAPRVKRLTADGDPYFAGVCLTDIPVSGGYGPIVTRGRVHVRCASDVTAGGLVVADFVTSNPGRVKLKSNVGAGFYPVVGYAITAAAEEPSTGSGSYWCDVMLDAQNAGALQTTLRGGGLLMPAVRFTAIGSATTHIAGFFRMPASSGSITNFVICCPTAITGDNANAWVFSLAHVAGTAVVATYTTTLGNNISATAANVIAATTNLTYTANELMRVDLTVAVGAPTSLATTRVTYEVEVDTGIGGSFPAMYGR